MVFSVGNLSLIVSDGRASNSEFFQKANRIKSIWSVCPLDDWSGSCVQKHNGTEAVIEARFDVSLVFQGRVKTQTFIEKFMVPIWIRMFKAHQRLASHGDVAKSLQDLEQILLNDTNGQNRVLLIVMALLAGYYWRYEYSFEDLYQYIVQLRPICEFTATFREWDQGAGVVRRAEGSQQSARNGYLRAGMPA